jgi:hypothetical protein
MGIAIRMLALAAGLAVAACSRAEPALVPVSGGGVGALAGEWEGSYASPQTGRGGSIVFRLTAGRDTAEGDVVMVPRGTAQPLQRAPDAPGAASAAAHPIPEALAIRFVRAEGGRVSGQLEPYRDPDCACPVSTVFEGTVSGDRIEGTFTTRGSPAHGTATGTWRVRRKP